MELTEKVHKLEMGYHNHEVRLSRVEKENEKQLESEKTFHDFMVAYDARAEGRDRTLKTFMTILTVISIISPALTILINSMLK